MSDYQPMDEVCSECKLACSSDCRCWCHGQTDRPTPLEVLGICLQCQCPLEPMEGPVCDRCYRNSLGE